MQYSDKIELLDPERKKNANGYMETTYPSGRAVWADVHSVGRTEFYKAAAIGKQTVIAFGVHLEDYKGESCVRYQGKVYSVLRPYQKGMGDWELTCTDVDQSKAEPNK